MGTEKRRDGLTRKKGGREGAEENSAKQGVVQRVDRHTAAWELVGCRCGGQQRPPGLPQKLGPARGAAGAAGSCLTWRRPGSSPG